MPLSLSEQYTVHTLYLYLSWHVVLTLCERDSSSVLFAQALCERSVSYCCCLTSWFMARSLARISCHRRRNAVRATAHATCELQNSGSAAAVPSASSSTNGIRTRRTHTRFHSALPPARIERDSRWDSRSTCRARSVLTLAVDCAITAKNPVLTHSYNSSVVLVLELLAKIYGRW